MKKQRILSALLALCIVFSLVPTALAEKADDFTDVSRSDWYYQFVDYVTSKGYFNGVADKTFAPADNMTRAMFVTVLFRFHGAKGDRSQSAFTDVAPGEWYTDAINWAAANRIVDGVGNGKFAPNDPITRAQMCTMIERYLDLYRKAWKVTLPETGSVSVMVDESAIPAWALAAVKQCQRHGLVNGFEDGTFRPTGYLRRSEFIKMLATSASLTYKSELPGKHWAEAYWAMLSENGVLEGLDIPCTFDALQAKTTRYEMAVMIRNFLAKVRGETEAVTNGAARRIPDWAYIPEAYRGAVAQVYAKGIINGMKNTAGAEDGSFCGERKLTRAQASAVMVRLLDPARRAPVDLSDNNPYRLADAPNGLQPFMIWARENGYMLNNNEPRGAFNKLFFGDENKTYFASAEEAAPYMRDVTVNVWQLQPDGTKTQAALKLTVHKYLAADVYEIFQRIFEDEEKFPIASVGGLRCTDTMRHAWGAAVDINPDANCAADRVDGAVKITVGQGWWPLGTEKSEWAGTLAEPSPYSIAAGGSVVRAFAAYGWGWGGTWQSSRDFMHFSVRTDGG